MFIETQPKLNLIPTLVELLRGEYKTEIQRWAIEMFHSLMWTVHNSKIDIDLCPAIATALGISNHNGLFHRLFRDCTTFALIRVENSPEFRVVGQPEFLSRETAENGDFIKSVLNFLSQYQLSQPRMTSGSGVSSIISCLLSLTMKPEGRIYPVQISIVTKAIRILSGFIRGSPEIYASVDKIIRRLVIELQNLGEVEHLVYAEKEFPERDAHLGAPRVYKLHELIRLLFKLLGNTVLIHSQHQGNIYIYIYI